MPRSDLRNSVQIQRNSCGKIGSPFYAALLSIALSDDHKNLPFWDVMDAWPGDPGSALLPLRLLAAIHDLVLDGRAGALARHFPDPERPGDPHAAWPLLNELVAHERAFVEARLDDEIQTNEVRRCAVLLPGFFEIHRRSGGLPIHLAELGASGGLNLCWDHYGYRLGRSVWGDPDAELILETRCTGTLPPPVPLEVLSRRGCDIAPLDLCDASNRRRLMSFIWPDQFERLDRLRRAIDVAAGQPIDLVRSSAGDFVDQVLARETPGAVQVIYHSIMWLYVPRLEREHIREAMTSAGKRADTQTPLAWLRMEFDDDERAALWLDYWPGAGHARERLAHCHYHGSSLDWIEAST